MLCDMSDSTEYDLMDLEIDEIFQEATKPYDYRELLYLAKKKELDKKCDVHVIANKIMKRLNDEMLKKAKLANGEEIPNS
jgi:hypothetical protein